MAIVTLAEVKAFRDITVPDHDGELSRLIPAAIGFAEFVAGRVLSRKTAHVDQFDGGEGKDPIVTRLHLRRPPVHILTKIEDDPLRGFGAAFELATTDFVLIDASTGLVRFDGYSPSRGIQNIKITYDGGYDADDATNPEGDKIAPLKEALIELIWAARQKGADALVGLRSKSIAEGSISFLNNGWPMDLLPILERYKLDYIV